MPFGMIQCPQCRDSFIGDIPIGTISNLRQCPKCLNEWEDIQNVIEVRTTESPNLEGTGKV